MPKAEFLHIRVDKDLKDSLKKIAKEQHRSLSSLALFVLDQYAKQKLREHQGVVAHDSAEEAAGRYEETKKLKRAGG